MHDLKKCVRRKIYAGRAVFFIPVSNPVPKEKAPEENHFDDAGMNGRLAKPVSREKLLNMIHKILKK